MAAVKKKALPPAGSQTDSQINLQTRSVFEGRILDRLVGHGETIDALLRAGERGRFPSALVFSGPNGVGKKMAALGLAQALVCERDRRACGACGPCLRVAHGQSEGLLLVEPTGVAIRVEQSRDVLQFLSLQKLGRARAVVIDRAHLLTAQAANALLKILEEPPPSVTFFLVTHQAPALLATIRSRCQTIRFASLASADLRRALAAVGVVDVHPAELAAARGSVEEALRARAESETAGEVRAAVESLLQAPPEPFPTLGLARLKEACPDRPSGLLAMRWAQEHARALAHRGAASRGISQEISQALKLAELALAAERDLSGNVDRGLVFENLWFDWARERQ